MSITFINSSYIFTNLEQSRCIILVTYVDIFLKVPCLEMDIYVWKCTRQL